MTLKNFKKQYWRGSRQRAGAPSRIAISSANMVKRVLIAAVPVVPVDRASDCVKKWTRWLRSKLRCMEVTGLVI